VQAGLPTNQPPSRQPSAPPSQAATKSHSSGQSHQPSNPHKHKKPHKKPHKQPAPPAGRPSADELAASVVQYYSLVPGDTQDGWRMLTPSFQRDGAGGRGAYEKWWHSIDRVSVHNAQGSPPNRAVATLIYYFKSGRVVSERTTFGFVRQGGRLKINSQS
jgi:hypothetical protein